MVALLRTGNRPWVEYAELVEDRGSASAVLEEELAGRAAPPQQTSLLDPPVPPRDGREPLQDEPAPTADELLAEAHVDLDRWSANGMNLVTVLEPDYPPNLRAVHDRPPMVFVVRSPHAR